jgi:hypothetical protein
MVPWCSGPLCGFICEVHEEADEGRERSISVMRIRGINLAFRDTDQSINSRISAHQIAPLSTDAG